MRFCGFQNVTINIPQPDGRLAAVRNGGRTVGGIDQTMVGGEGPYEEGEDCGMMSAGSAIASAGSLRWSATVVWTRTYIIGLIMSMTR